MENVPPFTVGLVPHYRLIEPLGGGGMGLVYKAFDERLNRPVALKFLPPEWSRDETARDRFMREARAASAVDHPNICTVHEIGRTDDGQLFIAMAFYDGETLKKKIERGPLPFPVAADFLLQTLRGLEKVHRCGIVHRDLKPANLMVTSDGIVKILDFGLATLALESRITHPGHVPGTVAYLSPEQARGEVAGPRSDLWALGVVLYEMLAGRRPFEGSAPGVVLDAIRKSDPPRLPVTRFGPVPPAVEEYVRKALAKRPAERFQSAGEMLWQVTDLRDTAARDSAQLPVDSREITPPLGPPLPPSRDAKGMRRAKILVAAVALAAAAGLGSFLWISERWIESPDEGVEAAGIGPAAAAPLRVGILKPRMLADPAPAADWPLLVQALLASELTGTAQLGVADPTTLNDRLEGALGSSRLERAGELAELLRRAGITLFLDGVIIQAEAGFRLVLNVVDVTSGEIELSRGRPVRSEGELPGVVKDLAREILGYFQFEQMGGQGEDLTPWFSLKRHNIEALRAFLQATHYIYRDEPGGARYLEQALAVDPDFVTPRVWLIGGLVAAGDFEEASKHYQHLVSLEPQANSFEQAMIAWSGAAIAEDLAAQAQHLEVALVFSPRNHILLHNLAWVRYQMGDCEAALRSLAPAVESRWSYPPAYMILGRCLLREGRFEEAARRLEESLAFTTPHLGVLAMLEALALLDGDREKARRYRARLAEREGSLIHDSDYLELGEDFTIVADACMERGNLECAHQALARAVALEPGVAAHHNRRGDLYLRAGSLPQAAAEFHKALEVDPSWTHAYLMLGRIAEQQGAHEEAVTHFRRWLELVPAHPQRERVEMRLKAVKPNG